MAPEGVYLGKIGSNQLRLFLTEEQDLGLRPERLLREIGETEFLRRHQCGVRTLAAFEKSPHADDWRDLMRLFLVRRTRGFIKEHYPETDPDTDRKFLTAANGTRLPFPERVPRTVKVGIDRRNAADQYARLYDEDVVDTINHLHLPRYGLANYVAPSPEEAPTRAESSLLNNLSRAGNRLLGFCRTNLFKRLESSGHAFLLSVKRHVLRNCVVLHALSNRLSLPLGAQDPDLLDPRFSDEDGLWGWPGDDAPAGVDPSAAAADLASEPDFAALAAEAYRCYAGPLRSRFGWLRPSLFVRELADHLREDVRALIGVLNKSGPWDAGADAKLKALANLLTKTHPNDKVLVFSQFADTVDYLTAQLRQLGIQDRCRVPWSCFMPAINCPHCGRALEEMPRDSTYRCPGCGRDVRIPSPAPTAAGLSGTLSPPGPGEEDEESGTLSPFRGRAKAEPPQPRPPALPADEPTLTPPRLEQPPEPPATERPMCQTPPLASAEAPPSTPLPAGRSGSAPLAAEPAPPGALQVPGYDLLNQLGKGAMGVVYKARHRTLKRLVALKMIRSGVQAGDEEVARFRIEAEAVARLQHPNIVQIYEIGELDGQPFFSLELVEGGGLDRKLAGNPLPFREAAELLEVLARTVHFAHQQGIIHRDLKPQNVLLSKEGQPKVTDFGLAKQLDDDSNQTRSGSIMGTPSYVAPEQAAGRVKEVGPRADVYSLGAMFYEFLTGRPPFRGETVMDTLLLVLNEDPVPPSQLRPKVPRDLETICLKCLHKDPRKRYASAEDLADDLRRYLNREPILARPLGPYGRTWRWCRRNPLAASILLAVTLGGAFGLWFLSRLSGQLVRSTALESAAQQGDMLEGVNTYYSDRIAGPLTAQWVYAGHDYARFQRTEPAIPIPATLTIELGQFISRESETGMRVRVYSDYPFRTRKDGGPRDDFEREALVRLRQNPKEPFYRFEQHEDKPVLRFAKARLMKESCIHCHLTHPDRNRSQPVWKAGDVRGVLEIIRPLEKDIEHTQAELRGSFLLIAGISAGLLVVSSLVLLVSNRRRRQRRA